MSIDRLLPQTAEAKTASCCAFYQVNMPERLQTNKTALSVSCLQHHCLLNPGRNIGPDGIGVSREACTVERQALCQQSRRARIAMLHATLPFIQEREPAANL